MQAYACRRTLDLHLQLATHVYIWPKHQFVAPAISENMVVKAAARLHGHSVSMPRQPEPLRPLRAGPTRMKKRLMKNVSRIRMGNTQKAILVLAARRRTSVRMITNSTRVMRAASRGDRNQEMMTGTMPPTKGNSLAGAYHTTPAPPAKTNEKPMMPPTAAEGS